MFAAMIAGAKPSSPERLRWRTALDRIADSFAQHAETSGRRDVRFYEKIVRNLISLEEMLSITPRNDLRDRRMADNILWLAEKWYPDRKIIIWAAGFHIARNLPSIDTRDASYNYNGIVNMGEELHRKLGDSAYSIGFTSYRGKWGTPSMTPRSISAPVAESLETMLHATGQPYSLAGLRGLPRDHWLRTPLIARPLGNQPMASDWTGNFDALFFMDVMFPHTILGNAPDGVKTHARP